jgi:hypothetical protein
MFNGHHFDIRPLRPGYAWAAYDVDRITPLGRGKAGDKGEAEEAAHACIRDHRAQGAANGAKA